MAWLRLAEDGSAPCSRGCWTTVSLNPLQTPASSLFVPHLRTISLFSGAMWMTCSYCTATPPQGHSMQSLPKRCPLDGMWRTRGPCRTYSTSRSTALRTT
eukprot:4037185-Pleurochrysis_carterae.AAC.1